MAKDKFFTDVAQGVKNKSYFEDGGTIDADTDDKKSQVPYVSASNICTTMDTVVPISMSVEQRKFNDRLKAACAEMGMSVEQYVAKKLHYKSVDDLCYQEQLNAAGERITRFAAEQIDAIATAIWNHETSDNGIIIADQAGSGKGRCAAGILRYAILELKVIPFFFTEKKHLLNDIYRDLIAIGFDAGIPYKFKKTVVVEKSEFTDDELLKIIIQDIKDRDDLRVDFSLPEGFNLDYIKRSLNESHEKYDEVEETKSEIIDAYRQHFLENGYERDIYELNTDYKQQVLEAMRGGRHLVQPFAPNLIDIKDIDGNILYEAMTKKEADQIYQIIGKNSADPNLDVSKLKLPFKYKLFAMPYSQVARGYENYHGDQILKNKIKLFQKYAHKGAIILDESHNASGLIRGELTNTGEIVFQLIKSAQMTTYLSATYAKRAENMPLYSLKTSIRECGLSDKEMTDTFIKGGNSLQEAVSSELARNGQLLRREKVIQGKSEYYYEHEGTETGDNQIAKLDRVAILYNRVLEFSSAVRGVIKEFKSGLSPEQNEKIKPSRSVNALAFQLFNFMLLGLKIRQTTQFAIQKLQTGRKTIIAVASTMESSLDNLSKTFMSNLDSDSYKIGDKIKNDFSLYMAYLLNYTLRYNLVDVKIDSEGNEEESKQTIYVLDSDDDLSIMIKDRLLAGYKNILSEILEFETGIPIAPLDMIERNIKEAGFSVSEITGRQRKITFNDTTTFGTIAKREIRKTDTIVREFNENDIDCLLINQSGATGISMHSLPNKKVNIVYEPSVDGMENAPMSLENKKEVKKRAMVITQMELDINKEIQKLGRINRMGQVYLPEYTYIISAIPSESRLTSLMEKKLRSLSANVSSNQQQASYLFTSDDFFSDIAVPPFNETLNDIGMRGSAPATTGADIQDFTKRLYFKDYTLQKDFYDTFSKKLQQEIETLTSQGLYTGKMTHKEYFAETIIQHPFYIGDNNAKTSFGRHSFIEKCTVKLFKEKFTEKKIEQFIKDGLSINNSDDETPGKEKLFFKSLPEFQKSASQKLNDFEIQKRELIDKSNKSIDDEIKKIDALIKTKSEQAIQFKDLSQAIDLESELTALNKKKQSASVTITDAIGRGDMNVVTDTTTELNLLIPQIKILEEKLAPMQEILKQKSDLKKIHREIKNAEDEKETQIKRKATNEKQLKEYTKLVSDTKMYLYKIGHIMQLDVYDLKIVYSDDDNSERITEFTPTLEFSHKVVVTGISFPNGYYDLTAGKVDVDVCGVSEKFSYNLYKLEKADPHQQSVKLSIITPEYKGRWNQIAGKIDNTYKEDRYIIVGSLLKTFQLGKSNEITGQIIKYNTIDNKTRIGIEIADNDDSKNGKKSVYKILEERYGSDTNLQHPIYYDGNTDNVNKFIGDYIYFYMFGEAYGKMDDGASVQEGTYQPIHSSHIPLRFVFQISSEDKLLLVVVNINDQLRESSNDLHKKYNAGQSVKIRQDRKQFFDAVDVEIISDSMPATDFIAYHFNQATGVDITNDNYQIASMSGKNKVFKNIDVQRARKINTLRFNYGEQFKTFFPTNIINLQSLLDYGAGYSSRVRMAYGEFSTLIQYFTTNRMKPTFATASDYFNKHKGDYIFEQFLDDIDQPESKKIVANVDFQESINAEIDTLINDLVTTLTNED